jgi:hypothetical protein
VVSLTCSTSLRCSPPNADKAVCLLLSHLLRVSQDRGSPSTKFSPSLKFVWAPARGLAYLLDITPLFSPERRQSSLSASVSPASREPRSGIEPETSSFVYTSSCERTRLYLSPTSVLVGDPCQSFGRFIKRHGLVP